MRKDIYLITGGRAGDMAQMVKDLRVALKASGVPQPDVAYIGTASGDSKPFFHAIRLGLLQAGAGSVDMVPLARADVDVAHAKRMLEAADVVFISGGEVDDGMDWLVKARLVRFLGDLYHAGTLFVGVSAGAIMLGTHWAHWGVEDDDRTARVIQCLGFVPYVFDAHGEKENWSELRCVLRLLGPGHTGHGLAAGGFYKVDTHGHLQTLRTDPVVLTSPSSA